MSPFTNDINAVKAVKYDILYKAIRLDKYFGYVIPSDVIGAVFDLEHIGEETVNETKESEG